MKSVVVSCTMEIVHDSTVVMRIDYPRHQKTTDQGLNPQPQPLIDLSEDQHYPHLLQNLGHMIIVVTMTKKQMRENDAKWMMRGMLC